MNRPGDEAEPLTATPDFVPRETCRTILEELGFARWYPSTVVERVDGERLAGRISACRVSETTDESWFTTGLRTALEPVNRALEAMLPGFEARREGWQATRYSPGGRFRPHTDCGHWDGDPAGEREHTVLIFLNRPRSGGETCFPFRGEEYRPQPGLLLVWRNLTADRRCDRTMTHSSLPVLAGRKTVLVTWLRQRPFRRRR